MQAPSAKKATHCSSPQLAELLQCYPTEGRQGRDLSLADLARGCEATEGNRARRLGLKEKLSSAVALTIPPTLGRVSTLTSSSQHREEHRKAR